MLGHLHTAIFMETIYAHWLNSHGAGSYEAVSRADSDVQTAYRRRFKSLMWSALSKKEG